MFVTGKGGYEVHSKGMDMRILAAAVIASMTGPAFAQTQPTRPSAYATGRTMPSAFATAALNPCHSGRSLEYYFALFHDYRLTDSRRGSSFNPTSPCYTGTMYPSYSAITPIEFPERTNRQALPGANDLNEDQAKSRIEAKGYSSVSGLQQDNRGIWRGKATMKDGRFVAVVLDLEGNIYSRWFDIRITPKQ
jgi:hypothetical protein